LKGLQEKTRGNFLDKNKKAAGFMLRPLINQRIFKLIHSRSNSANKYAYTTAQKSGRIAQIRLME
jgi:hypothetical protein